MTSPADDAISLENVTFAYNGEPVIENVAIRVRRGERLGILGPNGGGKSTLLRVILGELDPDAGSVRVLGRSPAAARRTGKIGYLPQRVTAELSFPLDVRRVVEQGVAARVPPWRPLGKQRHAAARALDLVGMTDLADRPIGRLSGGQLQRVLIARSVAAGPEVLLLDEPTVGIDVAGQQQFGDMLETLRREMNLTVVIVSHDLATIAASSDRVACLRRTLHFHDTPNGLTPAVLAEVFSHDIAMIDAHKTAHPTACSESGPTHDPDTTPGCGCGGTR
ncbi:MAG TPA: metal ABC transporter ATP-binding protein [Phycisphaerales bacterium]|nr:metal ABC transporter ATP-binding protein [Phycisphaerales bacterium]